MIDAHLSLELAPDLDHIEVEARRDVSLTSEETDVNETSEARAIASSFPGRFAQEPAKRATCFAYAATANRRCGKFCFFTFILSVSFFFCSGVSARRIARVFFMRRSNGVYFFPAYSFRASSRLFCVYTVKTLAMLLRTVPILASFDAAPPVTFATRSCES